MHTVVDAAFLAAPQCVWFRISKAVSHPAIAAYCHTQSSVGCVCVCVCVSVCQFIDHVHEPCRNCVTDRDAIWMADSGEPRKTCS